MASMNVVPLIDILLVLIIIFMVITPLTPKGLDALVPQPAPPNQKQQQDQTQAKTIVVQVLDNNKLKINEDDATWDHARPAAERYLQAARREGGFRQGRRHRGFREGGPGHRHHARLRDRQGRTDHGQARSGQ